MVSALQSGVMLLILVDGMQLELQWEQIGDNIAVAAFSPILCVYLNPQTPSVYICVDQAECKQEFRLWQSQACAFFTGMQTAPRSHAVTMLSNIWHGVLL